MSKQLSRSQLLNGEHNQTEVAFWARFWDLRGIGEYPCVTCTGTGVRSYSSSAGWRSGAAGQTVTTDVCNDCWGTGDALRLGVNLRVALGPRGKEASALDGAKGGERG